MTNDTPPHNIVPVVPAPLPAPRWGNTGLPAPTVPRPPYERPLAALRRYKWLVLGILILAVIGGMVATRMVKPQYEVRATIWIEPETPVSNVSGPIRSRELLNASAWEELLRSYRIVDAVVRKLRLYVRPDDSADLPLFAGFGIAERFLPGKYEVEIDRTRKRWQLKLVNGTFSDDGSMADSVGVRAGLRWVIPVAAFEGRGTRNVKFTVSTPRETAIELMNRLSAELPRESNFLWLRLRDEDPQMALLTLISGV
jgi:hypothetical protein